MKIGMLDHHLNNYHSDKFLSLLRGPLASEGLEIVSAWEIAPTGDDWCAKNKVRRAASAEDAVRDVDAIMVMAPDNIEEHLKLCAVALPLGKPTLIDKFLAPNLHDAREVVDLAMRHKTPILSSSSLRYAVELEAAMPKIAGKNPVDCYATGMGKWEGYGVHTLAMVMRMMGHDVKRVIDTGTATARNVALDYGDGRRGQMSVRTAKNEWDLFGWSFGARVGDEYVGAQVKEFDGFYANLMRRTAAFFKSGKAEMEVAEALMVVAVLEAANKSMKGGGAWVGV